MVATSWACFRSHFSFHRREAKHDEKLEAEIAPSFVAKSIVAQKAEKRQCGGERRTANSQTLVKQFYLRRHKA